jgi:hypothetical protein
MIELLLKIIWASLVLVRAVIGRTEVVIGPSNCSVHAEAKASSLPFAAKVRGEPTLDLLVNNAGG